MNFSMNFTGNASSRCHASYLVSSETDADGYEYSPAERTLRTVVMPVILCLGLLGNLGFIFVLWRVTWMRTTLNFFLTNLAVADIVILTVSVIEKVVGYLTSPVFFDEYFLGAAGCVLVPLVKDVCYFASVSLVTLVTLERYYATCHPHVHRERSTRARPIRLVATVWFLSLALACTIIPSNSVFYLACLTWPALEKYESYPDIMGICLSVDLHSESKPAKNYADAIHCVPFVGAMLVNVIFFSLIVRALNSMVARAQRSGFSDRSQHIRDRVSRMLVINGIVFFLCLAPRHITLICFLFSPDGAQKEDFVWMQVCRVLVYVNSAANPVVYNVTNVRYRKAFHYAFTTRRGHSQLKNYLTRRPSSNMEMNNRGNTGTRATSNAHTSTQPAKGAPSTF